RGDPGTVEQFANGDVLMRLRIPMRQDNHRAAAGVCLGVARSLPPSALAVYRKISSVRCIVLCERSSHCALEGEPAVLEVESRLLLPRKALVTPGDRSFVES